MIKELIYLPLDIPNPPNVSCFFDTVLESDMILDNYRTCSHIPIMSPTGELTNIGKQVTAHEIWTSRVCTAIHSQTNMFKFAQLPTL